MSDLKMLISRYYHQVLLVFAAFLIMVLVSSIYVSNIVSRQMQIIGDSSMDSIQTTVSANLKNTELFFINITHNLQGMLNDGRDNRQILSYLEELNSYFNADGSPLPELTTIYGYIRGEWLDGSGWVPPPDYVPELRPWYIGANQKEHQTFFSEPYLDAMTGDICVSFSRKLFGDKGQVYGVLAVDLRLALIASYVQRQKIAGHGYGVLIDNQMNFMVHPDQTLRGKNVTLAGGGYSSSLARILQSGNAVSAVDFQDADGVPCVIFFRTLFNGWHLGVVIPKQYYYRGVYSLAIMLGTLSLLLATMLSYLLVRYRAEKLRSDEENLSKDAFLARMSHEMRTPMNAIIGMANIARTSEDEQKKMYCLDRIDEAAKHLLGVINDVLDMSKIGADKLELSETDFLLSDLLRQVHTIIGYKIEQKSQNFETEIGEDVPTALVADRQRLAQVIANLLSNANKFTPERGRILLRVERIGEGEKANAPGRIELRFTVEDSGIGIHPEQQKRLFQAFEQADGSISRRYGGTGLGLVISKRIVELMGGRIWIESEEGRGARFLFTINTRIGSATEAAERKIVADNAAPADYSGKHILLAEDAPLNREIVIELLKKVGLTIAVAENGRIACEMFAAAPASYDMIFMDIQMPEMGGYEAVRRIRAMDIPWAAEIPIVAMTANVFREDIERCHATGMNDHIGKPLTDGVLQSKLKKYLA